MFSFETEVRVVCFFFFNTAVKFCLVCLSCYIAGLGFFFKLWIGFWYDLTTQHTAIQMEIEVTDEWQWGTDWEWAKPLICREWRRKPSALTVFWWTPLQAACQMSSAVLRRTALFPSSFRSDWNVNQVSTVGRNLPCQATYLQDSFELFHPNSLTKMSVESNDCIQRVGSS